MNDAADQCKIIYDNVDIIILFGSELLPSIQLVFARFERLVPEFNYRNKDSFIICNTEVTLIGHACNDLLNV